MVLDAPPHVRCRSQPLRSAAAAPPSLLRRHLSPVSLHAASCEAADGMQSAGKAARPECDAHAAGHMLSHWPHMMNDSASGCTAGSPIKTHCGAYGSQMPAASGHATALTYLKHFDQGSRHPHLQPAVTLSRQAAGARSQCVSRASTSEGPHRSSGGVRSAVPTAAAWSPPLPLSLESGAPDCGAAASAAAELPVLANGAVAAW